MVDYTQEVYNAASELTWMGWQNKRWKRESQWQA